MKIIDAVWEKRNLGFETTEFIIESSDNEQNMIEQIINNEKQYNVVKLPTFLAKFNLSIQKLGYKYIENICSLSHDLNPIQYNSIQKRMIECVRYEIMTTSDLEELFSEIKKGMFYTDRISLDSFFNIECANQRYIYWLKDEIEKGSKIFKMMYKNENIGFFAFKEIEEGVFFPFLSGVYEKYNRSGLGVNIAVKPIEEAIKRNGKLISTYVSVNNRNSLETCLNFGYKIRGIESVFIKHVE